MNRINARKQKQIIAALVEGNSIHAPVRMTGVSKNAILKFGGRQSISAIANEVRILDPGIIGTLRCSLDLI